MSKVIQYKNHWIIRTFPSGYYESYIAGHFCKSDTLQGIRGIIDEHVPCDCSDEYNCCDCGGNDCGCRGCFSCNACDSCKGV